MNSVSRQRLISHRSLFFFRWDILITETFQSFVSQLFLNSPLQCSLADIFRHSDRNDWIFFGHFKNIPVYDRKKQLTVTIALCALPVRHRHGRYVDRAETPSESELVHQCFRQLKSHLNQNPSSTSSVPLSDGKPLLAQQTGISSCDDSKLRFAAPCFFLWIYKASSGRAYFQHEAMLNFAISSNIKRHYDMYALVWR